MKKTNDPAPAHESRLALTSMADLCAERTEPNWLVDQVLVADQTMVIGGPPKVLKTSLALDLAVSLATGTRFLNRFPVPRACPVAVYSGESGRQVINETVQRICRSRNEDPEECDLHCCFNLPRLDRAEDCRELRVQLRARGVGAVIVDPLYLALGDAVPASNLYKVGPVLTGFANACLRAGATPILVHHTVKAAAKTGAVGLHELSFAGIGEFARQWLLVNRRTEYQPGTGVHDLALLIGGSAGHSSNWCAHVEEGSSGPSRRWSVSVRLEQENAGAALHPDSPRPNRTGRL